MYIMKAMTSSPATTQEGSAMTETPMPQPPPPIGREVALAQRVLSELLAGLLREVDTTFETWLVLDTLATQGQPVGADSFRRDLAGRLRVDESSIAQLVDRLRADGGLRVTAAGAADEAHVEFTSDGAAFHRRLSERIRGNTVELLSPLDSDDVQTTVRVLRAITEGARALIAS